MSQPHPLPLTNSRPSVTTLPPGFRGDDAHGRIWLTVDSVLYYPTSADFSQRRSHEGLDVGTTLVRLKWWGEQGEGTVWRPQPARVGEDGNVTRTQQPTRPSTRGKATVAKQEFELQQDLQLPTVTFPIMTPPTPFCKYLSDTQWLVFDVYHFQETDPSAIHRDFIKQLRRASHPNRAHPQTKAPLCHAMLDLAPLTRAIAAGEIEWNDTHSLPLLVNGVAVGQLNVMMHTELVSTQLTDVLGDVPRPAFESSGNQSPFAQPSRTIDYSTSNGIGSGVHSPVAGSPTIGSPTIGSPARSHSPVPHQYRPSADPYDHISHLISQSEEMTKNLGESILGAPLDVPSYIQQQQQKLQQEHQQDQSHPQSPPRVSFAEHKSFSPSSPASTLAPSTFGAAYPGLIQSANQGLSASGRPFSQPPPFADFQPAPEHYFPLPILPTNLESVPPFSLAAEPIRTKSQDATCFIDDHNLLTIWFRIRRVILYKSSKDKERRLGGREAEPNVQPQTKHDVTAGVQELIASKRKAHAEAHRRDSETSGQGEGSFVVLHYQFFPDIEMGRTPALFAPLRGEQRPAYFHYHDSAPRIYSHGLLTTLKSAKLPIEIYAYRKKPAFTDPRDRQTRKFIPSPPNQVILARTEIPFASLLHLRPYGPYISRGQPWLQSYLQSHIGLNSTLPIFDPHSPSPIQIGEIEVVLGWGCANDVNLLDEIEMSAIVVQKCIRGFLSRRRLRRQLLERKIAELKEEEEEEEAKELEYPTQSYSTSVSAPAVETHPISQGSPLSTARSTALSPAATPRPREKSPRPLELRSTHDVSTSPLPLNSYHAPPPRTSQLPSFHLNLPLSPSQRTPRKQPSQSPRRSPRSQPQQPVTFAPMPITIAPVIPDFIPAPREEDFKDFVSFNYARTKPNAVVGSSQRKPLTTRSFEETLKQIELDRAANRKQLDQHLARPPTIVSSPSRLIRVGTTPTKSLDQSVKQKEIEEEEKQKYDSEAANETDYKTSQPAASITPVTTPPRSRQTPVRSSPPSTGKNQPLSPQTLKSPSNQNNDDDLLSDEYSEVDVSDYEDDFIPESSSPPQPQTTAPTTTATITLAAVITSSSSTLAPSSLSSFLPSSLDNFDTSVGRRLLQQQMNDLDRIERRLKWKLSGRSMDEFDKQNQTTEQQQEQQQPSTAIISPIRPTVGSGVVESDEKYQAPSQSPSQPRFSATPSSGGHFLSPVKSDSSGSPLSLPPHDSPDEVRSHSSSPMRLGSASPIAAAPAEPSTPVRSAATRVPMTPSTPQPLFTPARPNATNATTVPIIYEHHINNTSSNVTIASPPPIVNHPSQTCAAVPTFPPATGTFKQSPGQSTASVARSASSTPEFDTAASSSFASSSLPPPLGFAGYSNPSMVRGPSQETIPSSFASNSTPTQSVSHSTPQPTQPHQSIDEVQDYESDVSVDDDSEDVSDDLDTNDDDDGDDDKRVRWGVNVNHPPSNLNVQVQYSTGGDSARSSSSIAEQRARLFPSGLRGSASNEQEPGASSSGSSRSSFPTSSTTSSAYASAFGKAPYSLTEEEAKNMHRVARILANK